MDRTAVLSLQARNIFASPFLRDRAWQWRVGSGSGRWQRALATQISRGQGSQKKTSQKNTRRPPERLRVCRCVVCINKTTKNNVFKENLLPFNHRNGMPISLSWAQSYNGGVSTQYSTKKPRASASSKAPRMRMPLLAAYWLLHLKHWCLSLEQFTTSRLPNGRK